MKILILPLLSIVISCSDIAKRNAIYMAMPVDSSNILRARIDSILKNKSNIVIKVSVSSEVDSTFYRVNNIEHELDNEKDSIVITEGKYNAYIITKPELKKILTCFPILNDSNPRNPDESYNSSGIWKKYIDTSGNEQKISFGSQAGQDDYYQIYAYLLKKKDVKKESIELRKNLALIFQYLNRIFGKLNYGGTYFGHQSMRISGYVEYAIHFYNPQNKNQTGQYDITSQKQLFINSLNQIINDEVAIDQNTFTLKEKEKYKKELFIIVRKIDALISNPFYLRQARKFQYLYY